MSGGSRTTTLAPNPANKCFGCGGAADAGMLLTFEQDNVQRKIVGKFVLGPRYQGGGGIVHGGIIAMVLDEAMGKVCRFRGAQAVTADMNIDYLKPIGVNQEIFVEAFETAQVGRNLFQMCEIRDAAGEILARGRARFVVLRTKEST
ncbi:MAG TPA: hotdog domain-containing protein [Candidatus Acidoferrum sp.]|nr:hotdog domain-containing protein [Candidatus Acidoferrum sp.]